MSDRYLKLFTSLAMHPKWRLRLATDADRVAYIVAMCAAKDAGADGRFESREHLELVLGSYAGSVEALIEAGLIDEIPDTGELWIHDFEERQRPMTSAERQAAWRERHRLGRHPGPDPDDDEGGSGEGEAPPKKRRKPTSPRVDNGVDNESPNAVRDEVHNGGVMPDITTGVMRIGEERRVEKKDSFARTREGAIERYRYLVGGRALSDKEIDRCRQLIRDHGADKFVEAMEIELSGGRRNLFSRAAKKLRDEALERNRAADERRAVSEEAGAKVAPAIVDDATAKEQREAIAAFAGGFKMEGES